MSALYLPLDQFKTTVNTGGISSVTVKAQGAIFIIEADSQKGGKVLLIKSKGNELREFRDSHKALLLLWELGIREAKIDARNWHPEQIGLEKVRRPDRSKALQAVHAAAEMLRSKNEKQEQVAV